VQVADDSLHIGQFREPAEVGLAGGLQRGQPGRVAPAGEVVQECEVGQYVVDQLRPGDRPVPGH
jgi:hypothetical protein